MWFLIGVSVGTWLVFVGEAILSNISDKEDIVIEDRYAEAYRDKRLIIKPIEQIVENDTITFIHNDTTTTLIYQYNNDSTIKSLERIDRWMDK